MADFYTLVTKIGLEKINAAIEKGTKVALSNYALGDGNGVYVNPTATQKSLVNEKYRGTIGNVSIDSKNPNWLNVECVVPIDVGGFTIREVGLYDEVGDLIAVSKHPATYKPLASEGTAKELFIRNILAVTNASAVTISIDNTDVYITKEYVDHALEKKYTKPANGIPKTDLASEVQTSLTKADDSAKQTDLATLDKKVTEHQADYVSHTGWVVATGSANAYIATLTPALSKYQEGVSLRLKINVDNTGASTVDVNELGPKTIKKANGAELTSGSLKVGSVYTIVFNGTNFILQGEGGELTDADIASIIADVNTLAKF